MPKDPFYCVAKNVLCNHQETSPVLHSAGGVSYFLPGQRDVMASYSFGVCTVQTDFHQLSEVEEFCGNIVFFNFILLCQLTCQSAGIMSSLCGVGVRVHVRVNNFSSKTTRPRDVLFFLKDTLSIEDEKLFKACKSVCSSVC